MAYGSRLHKRPICLTGNTPGRTTIDSRQSDFGKHGLWHCDIWKYYYTAQSPAASRYVFLVGVNSIDGNVIGVGLPAAGGNQTPQPNTSGGILINQSSGNKIGVAAANQISGNSGNGISLIGQFTFANIINNNFIGTNTAGTARLGNTGVGLSFDGSTGSTPNLVNDNVVGNDATNNLIQFNTRQGVVDVSYKNRFGPQMSFGAMEVLASTSLQLE